MSKTKTQRCWSHMKTRCTNSNCKDYINYGGRGITYTESWEIFANFLTDMGEAPEGDYSLDRIDVNGNYCKENCRWASRKVQNSNKRIYRNNKSGVSGISLYQTPSSWAWRVSLKVGAKFVSFYYGKDFFEACCTLFSCRLKYGKGG